MRLYITYALTEPEGLVVRFPSRGFLGIPEKSERAGKPNRRGLRLTSENLPRERRPPKNNRFKPQKTEIFIYYWLYTLI